MKIKLIRNATLKIFYAGKVILTDPMFSKKYDFRSFAGISKNPTVDLSGKIEEIIKGVECVIVSHYHPDHLDEKACEVLDKNITLFTQPDDSEKIKLKGFTNVIPIQTSHTWQDIKIIRTNGQHGKGEILNMMGNVSGFILKAPEEPTVYWVGDSVYCKDVEDAIDIYKPDIIITHSGGAVINDSDLILMDAVQTVKVLNKTPYAKVIAVHMEALDHCRVSREGLKQEFIKAGIDSTRYIIPKDGEEIDIKNDNS